MKATQVKLVLLGEWLLLLVPSWRDGTGYVPRGCAGLCVVVSGLQGCAAGREGLQALSWTPLENTFAGESHMLRFPERADDYALCHFATHPAHYPRFYTDRLLPDCHLMICLIFLTILL
jgi:hypothetical protein